MAGMRSDERAKQEKEKETRMKQESKCMRYR